MRFFFDSGVFGFNFRKPRQHGWHIGAVADRTWASSPGRTYFFVSGCESHLMTFDGGSWVLRRPCVVLLAKLTISEMVNRRIPTSVIGSGYSDLEKCNDQLRITDRGCWWGVECIAGNATVGSSNLSIDPSIATHSSAILPTNRGTMRLAANLWVVNTVQFLR